MTGVTGPTVVGVDVGGTKTLIGLIRDGAIVDRQRHVTRVGGDDVERVAGLVAAAVTQWSGQHPVAVGAGFPEYVDPSGRLTSSEVLTWRRQPVDVFAEAFAGAGFPGLPVVIDSDVRLAALAEGTFGAGAGHDSFLYVSLGTGLSASFVVRGRPWAGSRGEAIALGEWPIDGWAAAVTPDGIVPPEPDTLESFASGSGIAARYRRATGGDAAEARTVVAAAVAGDTQATAILASAGAALGSACAGCVALLDPSVVILGGGLGTAAVEPLMTALRHAYETRVSRRPGWPPLVPAISPDSGLLGAALAAQPPTASRQT